MKKLFFILSIFSFVIFSVSSCSQDEDPNGPGTLTLHFDNVAGDADLKLNTANAPYTNSKGETYKLTKLSYYITNIKVKSSDGTVFTDLIKSDGSAGYYLTSEADEESQDIVLENVPQGDYTEVTFTIGVDASKINQASPSGVLDPAKGMYWNSSLGHIFMAVEGVSSASPQPGNVFQYHIGGSKEEAGSTIQANNIKTITLSFNGNSAPVKMGHESEVHLIFDVNKFLNGSGSAVTFTTNPIRDTPKACVDLAGNIAGAFSVDHIHSH